MKSLALTLALFYLADVSFGQIVLPGNCPSYQAIKNLNVERYLGKWYEIQRYENWFSLNAECVAAEYSLNEDGSVRVFNSQKKNGEFDGIVGQAVVSYPEQQPLEGKLNVTFAGEPNRSNYWILDTDYDNYSIVWSCGGAGALVRAEFAWILARKPYIDGEVLDKVNANIDKYLKKDKLRKTNQNADLCFS
jgi:apolipoprotein D and lipocalin family protein